MKKNANIVDRKIHDTYFLINIKEDYSDEKCRLYEINEIGFFLWSNIIDGIGLSELTQLLLSALVGEIDAYQVSQDVEIYISSLKSMGFVEE